MNEEQEKFIDSIIVIEDGSLSPEFAERIKRLAYSIIFGSKKMNALGVKVEDASIFKEQNKRPCMAGRWRFIKNFKKVNDII